MEFCGYKDTTEKVHVEAHIAIRRLASDTGKRTGRTISHHAPSKTVHLSSVFTLSSELWSWPPPEMDVLPETVDVIVSPDLIPPNRFDKQTKYLRSNSSPRVQNRNPLPNDWPFPASERISIDSCQGQYEMWRYTGKGCGENRGRGERGRSMSGRVRCNCVRKRRRERSGGQVTIVRIMTAENDWLHESGQSARNRPSCRYLRTLLNMLHDA
jgi:hypothetical protein